MTVNNDINDDSATKHGDSHTRNSHRQGVLTEENSFRRELLRVGTPLTKMVVSVQIIQRYHQDSSFPFVSSFCKGQIHQWDSSQANTTGDTHSIDHFAYV